MEVKPLHPKRGPIAPVPIDVTEFGIYRDVISQPKKVKLPSRLVTELGIAYVSDFFPAGKVISEVLSLLNSMPSSEE